MWSSIGVIEGDTRTVDPGPSTLHVWLLYGYPRLLGSVPGCRSGFRGMLRVWLRRHCTVKTTGFRV